MEVKTKEQDADARLMRKRLAARLRQQRCRARKKAAMMNSILEKNGVAGAEGAPANGMPSILPNAGGSPHQQMAMPYAPAGARQLPHHHYPQQAHEHPPHPYGPPHPMPHQHRPHPHHPHGGYMNGPPPPPHGRPIPHHPHGHSPHHYMPPQHDPRYQQQMYGAPPPGLNAHLPHGGMPSHHHPHAHPPHGPPPPSHAQHGPIPPPPPSHHMHAPPQQPLRSGTGNFYPTHSHSMQQGLPPAPVSAMPPRPDQGRPPVHPRNLDYKGPIGVSEPQQNATTTEDQPTVVSRNPSTDDDLSKKTPSRDGQSKRTVKKAKSSAKQKRTPLATKEKAAIEAILSLGSSSSHDDHSATSGSDAETASLTAANSVAISTPPRRPSIVYTTGPGPATFIPVQADV